MPADQSTHSDEPTRVHQLVSRFLAGQSGTHVGGSLSVELTTGADQKDDCAILDVGEPLSIVVGTDYVRGSRFALYELGLLDNYDVGYYLVAANVSDVAAMGATPIGVLTVIRYPNDIDDNQFLSIVDGISAACSDFGTHNIGGDIGNAERIIVSATALGACQPGKAIRRCGAHPGDMLCITGPCGLLGAAVAYFPQKDSRHWALPAETESTLINAWKRPRARTSEGWLLGTHSLATACQDTSDGLKATIEQLMEASHVGFEVDEAAVPIDPCVRQVADLLKVDALSLAMSASADFQLAFTVNAQNIEICRRTFAEAGLQFHVIGRATPNLEVNLLTTTGERRPLPGVAWRHQKTDISRLVSDAEGR